MERFYGVRNGELQIKTMAARGMIKKIEHKLHSLETSVNTGTHIPLPTDVPLTARVEALCRSVGDLDKSDAILMTCEGKQMLLDQTIASYSSGTEQKPIYVFSKRRLEQSTPPQPPWPTVPSNPVEKELEDLLRKPPSPSNFQKQALVAKQLSDYAALVCKHGKILAEEYSLQYGGLQAAISNCKGIINECRKHHGLFSASVDGYISGIPNYKLLLTKFRETVQLLQLLPFPSFAYGPGTNPSTLHDWIKTQDEESSLDALEAECVKAVKQVEEEKLQQALLESEAVIAGQEEQIAVGTCDVTDKVISLVKKMEEIFVLQTRLAENIQATSQKALRNGDGTTIADLTSSHQLSLQMMQNHTREMWNCAAQLREIRQTLTKQVHTKLQSIAQMQMRLSTNNGCLVFWHECMKLAKRRFEVLQQVQCVPEVLGSVVAEVERRRLYRTLFLEHAKTVSRQFKTARDEERNQRRAFREKYDHHFILTLFPSLSDRPPEFAISIPEKFDEHLALLAEDDLAALKRHLPSDLQICNPVVLLRSQHDQETQTCTLDVQQIQKVLECAAETQNMQGQMEAPCRQMDGLNKESGKDVLHVRSIQQESYELLVQQRQALTVQLEEEQKKSMVLRKELEKEMSDFAVLKLQLENERQSWYSQLQQIECQKNTLRQETDEIIHKKDILTQENDTLSTQIAQITTERDALDRHIQQVICEKEALSRDIRQWGQKEEQLGTTIHQLQQCNRSLSGDNQMLKQQSEQLGKLVLQITNEKELLVTQLKKNEHDTHEKVESLKAQINDLSKSFECIQKERELWTVEQKRSWDEIGNLKVEKDTLSQNFAQCVEQKLILSKKLEALSNELESCKHALQQKCLEEAQHEDNEQLQNQLHLVKESLEQCNKELFSLYQQLDSKNKSIYELENSHAKMVSELRETHDKMCKLNNELVEVTSCLKVAESNLCAEKNQVCRLRTEVDSESRKNGELELQLKSCQDEKLRLQDELSEMMDTKMKESMELERELRELRRSTEIVATSPPSPRASSVAISNLQIGDQAIFIADPNHNYVALTLDGNTYYLHHSCTFNSDHDDTSKMCDPLKRCASTRGIFVGKITSKQLLEVKKETNRLKLPVGSRLYQVYAKHCSDGAIAL